MNGCWGEGVGGGDCGWSWHARLLMTGNETLASQPTYLLGCFCFNPFPATRVAGQVFHAWTGRASLVLSERQVPRLSCIYDFVMSGLLLADDDYHMFHI